MWTAQAITLQKLIDSEKVKCNHIAERTKSMKYIHNRQWEENNLKRKKKYSLLKKTLWNNGTGQEFENCLHKSPSESFTYVIYSWSSCLGQRVAHWNTRIILIVEQFLMWKRYILDTSFQTCHNCYWEKLTSFQSICYVFCFCS